MGGEISTRTTAVSELLNLNGIKYTKKNLLKKQWNRFEKEGGKE